jgi:hypothetical protein
MDPEEVKKIFDSQIIASDLHHLTCEEYSEAMIEEDDQITSECFDDANEEAHRAEEAERMQLIF